MLPLSVYSRPKRRLALRTIDAANRHLINPQLASSLGENRLRDDDSLQPSRRTLRAPRRSIRQDRGPAKTHRLRLVQERHNAA